MDLSIPSLSLTHHLIVLKIVLNTSSATNGCFKVGVCFVDGSLMLFVELISAFVGVLTFALRGPETKGPER